MQNAVILIRFLQCYQSACTIFLCHTCSPYNMNIHNILHIICDMYYAGPYFDAFKKSLSLIKSYLKICFVPFLHVPQNVPQTYIIVDWYSNKGIFVFRYMFLCSDEILNSLRVLFRVFFGFIFFVNPYPWSHIVNLYWFQNSDGFPFWKKTKKKKESYFLFHHEYWLEPNFFVGHSLYSRDFLSRSIKSIIWKERKP